jgi:hypothetical protein
MSNHPDRPRFGGRTSPLSRRAKGEDRPDAFVDPRPGDALAMAAWRRAERRTRFEIEFPAAGGERETAMRTQDHQVPRGWASDREDGVWGEGPSELEGVWESEPAATEPTEPSTTKDSSGQKDRDHDQTI